jgi:hypothetical protein
VSRDVSSVARLVEVANDTRQSAEVRAVALDNLKKFAPHLILPTGQVVDEEMYDKLRRLVTENEKEK